MGARVGEAAMSEEVRVNDIAGWRWPGRDADCEAVAGVAGRQAR